MNLQNKLSNEELEARSKQLDVREELVSKKEAILDTSVRKAQVTVLDKQISAKQLILDDIGDKIDAEHNRHTRAVISAGSELDEVKQSIKALTRDQSKLTTSNELLESSIQRCQTKLAAIKREINEARKYSKEQSELAESTIADWNVRLTEFQHEADLVHNEKTKIAVDIIRLDQDKLVLSREVDNLAEKTEQLATVYEGKAASYRDSLRELNDTIAQKQEFIIELGKKHQQRLKDIDSREKGLNIREAALRIDEQSLVQKERRLKANYGMAGLDYEE
jgi:chromosome segregation ATPase